MRRHRRQRQVRLLRYFPSFLEGLSLRQRSHGFSFMAGTNFPSFFGGTFIEAMSPRLCCFALINFPFFLEGLSLRVGCLACVANFGDKFPYPSVGTFIKASRRAHPCLRGKHPNLPYGFVGTFPNLFLLRSRTRHSPGTELFLFHRPGNTQTKNTDRKPHPPAATRLLHTSKPKTQHAGIAS